MLVHVYFYTSICYPLYINIAVLVDCFPNFGKSHLLNLRRNIKIFCILKNTIYKYLTFIRIQSQIFNLKILIFFPINNGVVKLRRSIHHPKIVTDFQVSRVKFHNIISLLIYKLLYISSVGCHLIFFFFF